MVSQVKPLDKIYQEASQWVRLANTIIWSMGTLLVPISFGFVGLALNKYSGAQYQWRGKVILGVGSVFLFSFWVYASRIYKLSTHIARQVLVRIEKSWEVDKKMSLYTLQEPILNRRVSLSSCRWLKRFHRFKLFSLQIPYGLFPLQISILVTLILVWGLILYLKL